VWWGEEGGCSDAAHFLRSGLVTSVKGEGRGHLVFRTSTVGTNMYGTLHSAVTDVFFILIC
jgi:hypothetical protein